MHHCSRRQFLTRAAAAAATVTFGARLARMARAQATAAAVDPATTTAPATTATTTPATVPTAIDRKALLGRHAVTLKAFDPSTVLHVGNGDFAFGVDVTGLQTFAEQHAGKFPLETLASWAWHTPTSPAATQPSVDPAAVVRRRVSLARLAFVDANGHTLSPDAISDVQQTLDLWAGAITSRFDHAGEPVEVVTLAHPTRNIIAVSVQGRALAGGGLGVRICFDGDASDALRTGEFQKRVDDLVYTVRLRPTDGGTPRGAPANAVFVEGTHLEIVVELLPNGTTGDDPPVPSFAEVRDAAAAHWETFWTEGAAIDFSGCTDTRAPELERRVVLSQYLTAVHCGGSQAVTSYGLAFSGQSAVLTQLDTQWWRSAQFAMWGRPAAMERTLAFFKSILPAARASAVAAGLKGARWPRACGADGVEASPELGPFTIWQQPHVIYFAEAAYRANRTRETLDKYAELVDETARFMAAYARVENAGTENERFVLGPNLIPAQESYAYDKARVLNPTFELAYWAWGLGVAQKWRDRLGQPREESWDRVQQKLAKPTKRDGRYAAIETEPFLINGDHPSFLWALGLLPKTHLIDDDVMRETARWTRAKWKWNDAWGVDFAGLAQTAARLGDAELAVDALLIESERNRYTPIGHNHPSDERPIDLSANGALLAAVALMAGGWEGLAPTAAATPGFPKNGKWDVRVEGFGKVI